MLLHAVAFLVSVVFGLGQPLADFFGLAGRTLIGRLHLWQLVSYTMVYTSADQAWSLVAALIFLLFFASMLEREWGALRLIVFYTVMAAATGLVRLMGGGGPVVGSIGVIYGFLGAFALVFRNERFSLFFAAVRAPYLVIGLVAILALLNLRDARNLLWLAGVPLGYAYASVAIRWERSAVRAPAGEKDRFKQLDI